ncbi:MAG TPA: glycosyltransferase [Alphaproteobacteria bacterium]|nr:glycosyltransferase [Alphaproteobacteria bacterium]
MRIVIDLQGAQTESRFRGIGRYTMSLAQAIVRNKGEHEVIIVLSGLFPDTIQPIRAAFDELLPHENILVWHAPGPVKACEPGNDLRREVAELIREAFLSSLKPDVILVASLFEGYVDDAVTSIGKFAQQLISVVILFDLIPLLNPEIYLIPNPLYKANYLNKIEGLKKADFWLTISASAAKEGHDSLGFELDRIFNISTACDGIFSPLEISREDKDKLLSGYGISRSFVFYSGGSDERKNLSRLIQAYSALPPHLRECHQLVLSGKMPEYSVSRFKHEAKSAGLKPDELCFTGHVSDQELIKLYNLCKLFVFPSWHEGFGLPALEAMACGAAVVASNTTSVSEVVGLDDALFDPFDVGAIKNKLMHVLEDKTFRTKLGTYGKERAKKFSWDESAKNAIAAFERLHDKERNRFSPKFDRNGIVQRLVNAIANVTRTGTISEADLVNISSSIARNHPKPGRSKRIYLDVSELVQRDAGSGIQRVTRAITKELLSNQPVGYIVEAVYSSAGSRDYRRASMLMHRLLGEETYNTEDVIIEPQCGDIFVGLDLQPQIIPECRDYYQFLRQQGVKVFFVVYDLLPITLPKAFPSDQSEIHSKWLEIVLENDGAICISKAVADELRTWMETRQKVSFDSFALRWFHLGADIENSAPSIGVPDDAEEILSLIKSRPTFLMVGTIEPRKGYGQALSAFESLWGQGIDVGLIIVGKKGWQVDQLVEMIMNHKELGSRLFWLDGISDEYLRKIYKASTCLLAPSEGEGFGLPLIEAARHKLPIIARDLPVFREVAGENAFFFSGKSPNMLESALNEWLSMHENGQAPSSSGIKFLTWFESANQFIETILEGKDNKRACSESQTKLQSNAEHAISSLPNARQPSVLLLSPYPIRRPHHGGQLRTAAIRMAFETAGFLVRSIGFYQEEAYSNDELGKFDVAFPSDSPYRLYTGKLLPMLSDFLMSSFSVSDDHVFEQVAKNISFDIDVIVTEQPWFHPLAKRLKREIPQCQNSIIVFSSQNIEASMKRTILGESLDRSIVDIVIPAITMIERTAARESDLTVAVTTQDAEILRSYGAPNLLIASNGINPWYTSHERIDYWQTKLPLQPWPIFIASAHPPNYQGFINSVGDTLGFIPPGSKLVVVGGVGPHLMRELSKSRWCDINLSRIQVLGVLDDDDIAAVKSLAHAFILPIGAGGGSNIKTAEALYSGKPVVCTSTALRGFEAYRSLPEVLVADTPKDFKLAVHKVLESTRKTEHQADIHRNLRERLTWEVSLRELPQEVLKILSSRRNV